MLMKEPPVKNQQPRITNKEAAVVMERPLHENQLLSEAAGGEYSAAIKTNRSLRSRGSGRLTNRSGRSIKDGAACQKQRSRWS